MTVQQAPQKTWPDLIRELEPEFNELSSTHKAVRFKEECEFALQAFGKNAALSQCQVSTVQSSIKNVAAIGLTLNPSLGYAWLVPDSIKAGSTWVKVCDLRISFQGLVKLATDSGAIKLVKAEIVRAGDTFEYNGPFEMPVHKTNPFDQANRGDPIGVYCVAITHEDRPIVDLMPWDEVMKIKSKAKTQNVWNEWTEEMAKKAILKRAYKQWPKTQQMERLGAAVSHLNETEGSREESYTEEQREKFMHYLEVGTAIEFVGYVRHLEQSSDDAYNGLYNSGEKGSKVKLKDFIKAKTKQGWQDIEVAIHSLSSDDDEIREEAKAALTDIELATINSIIKERSNRG